MAATITIHVFTGASAATPSGSVTGIDLISADNATNSLANRVANPISACSYSYEKWISACITASPANNVGNFQTWSYGDGWDTSTTLNWGVNATGSTPINTVSTVATTDFNSSTSAAKGTWDSASYAATGCTISFLVLQLEVLTAASAGNWTQETIYYSYDET